MTDLVQWGSAAFPQDHFHVPEYDGHYWPAVRKHKTLALSAAAAFALVIASPFGVGYIRHEHAVEQAALLHEQRANAELQDALVQLRDQVGVVNQSLGVAQRQIAVLSDQSKRQLVASEQAETSKVAQLAQALDQAQRELHLTEAQRVTLMARLSMAETAGREEWQKKLQELSADRDRTASERDQLRARIGELEQKLSLQNRQSRANGQAQTPPTQSLAAVAPVPAPAPTTTAATAPAASAPLQRQVAIVMPQAAPAAGAAAVPAVATTRPAATVAVTTGRVGQFERVLASAGVDVAHLFAQFGVSRGEGGPFVPVSRGPRPENTLNTTQLEALARLVQALPVSAPLQNYELGSPFGVRSDPINGRHEFHTGIDMLAPYMSPIYATAPGVVTFAGYRDDYGKVVEIDHGHGISTRYAHMHRFIVSVGQRVGAHTQIGYLGSTGRVTGPHVHYEVLVNGEPQDPEKFLGLARLVPVAAIR